MSRVTEVLRPLRLTGGVMISRTSIDAERASADLRATKVLGRMLIVALTVVVIAGCHSRLPRPGKPTAPARVRCAVSDMLLASIRLNTSSKSGASIEAMGWFPR
jgi:hypothetical protein